MQIKKIEINDIYGVKLHPETLRKLYSMLEDQKRIKWSSGAYLQMIVPRVYDLDEIPKEWLN